MNAEPTTNAEPKKAGPRSADHRIYWSGAELRKVCDAVIRILKKDRSLTLKTAVERAQIEVLPIPRHRPKYPYIAAYGTRCNAAFNRAQEDALGSTKPEPAAVPAPVAKALLEPAPDYTEPGLSNFTTPYLIAEILLRAARAVDRMGDVLPLLARQITAAESVLELAKSISPGVLAYQQPPPAPVDRTPPKPELPIVGVVGPMRDQFQHIVEKTSELPFRLVFVDKEKRRPEFPKVDYLIVQRHIGHNWWNLAQKVVPSNRLAFVDGITTAVQRIHDFHAQRVAAAASGQGETAT